MKNIIAAAIITFATFGSASLAQAHSDFPGYPSWAQEAFEQN